MTSTLSPPPWSPLPDVAPGRAENWTCSNKCERHTPPLQPTHPPTPEPTPPTLTQVAPYAESKPRLLLPNSVYLQSAASSCDGAADGAVLSVANVQAGEPYQLELVHTQQRAELTQRRADETTAAHDLQRGPLRAVCAALAAAARLVHPHSPCIAILSKPLTSLALRTRIDVRGVGERLRVEHGVPTVLYLSVDELSAAVVEEGTRELRLGPHTISAVYVRYDFSHPFGEHLDGADPRLLSGDTADLLRREWDVIDTLERSRAVLSSRLGSRLAHRRRVQLALASWPGAVENYLGAAESAEVRAVLPSQWPLSGAVSDDDAASAVRRFESQPDEFVAKSALRPRTGSGATQDRHASGGATRVTPTEIGEILRTRAAEWFVLYPKLRPIEHDATIVHDGKLHSLHEDADAAASELAVFGSFLAASPDDGGEVLINEVAGMGARTRPASASHPLAAGLGYGALSCVAVH